MSQNSDPNSRPPDYPTHSQPQGGPYQHPGGHPGGYPQYGAPTVARGYPETGGAPARKRQKNVMGIIAFAVAVLGFIFACVPGALIVGWILLPIAFLLAIISFFLKGTKGFSIAALIISVVGTIVGILVFFFVVAASFDEAFSDDVSAEPAAQEAVAESGDEDNGSADEGTRDNPYSIGTTVSSDDWEMTVTDVTLDATDEVLAENEFNEQPDAGNQYMMVDVDITYTGEEPDGEMPMATIEYVTAGGNTFDGLDDMVVAPNELDSLETLYNGATTSGSIAIQIPTEDADAGVLAISPDMFADKVYVSVK